MPVLLWNAFAVLGMICAAMVAMLPAVMLVGRRLKGQTLPVQEEILYGFQRLEIERKLNAKGGEVFIGRLKVHVDGHYQDIALEWKGKTETVCYYCSDDVPQNAIEFLRARLIPALREVFVTLESGFPSLGSVIPRFRRRATD